MPEDSRIRSQLADANREARALLRTATRLADGTISGRGGGLTSAREAAEVIGREIGRDVDLGLRSRGLGR